MNHTKKNKLPLYIGIPVILLLIFLRFGLYFLKSDGFSGLSMLLPILLLCFILFALCTCGFFAAWVYQDCKKRGDDPVLWAIVVFIATPFIGLLIYFLRRSEIKATCPACGHRISLKAKYCEECGTHIENKENNGVMVKQETHHLKFIVAGIISMVLMLVCLTGFIVSAATGNTYITNLIHSSVDPKTVQYLAGHESSKITMDIYAKVKYNRPDELVRTMGGAFAQWDAAQA